MSWLSFIRSKPPPPITAETLTRYRRELTIIAHKMKEQFSKDHPCHSNRCFFNCEADIEAKQVRFVHQHKDSKTEITHVYPFIHSPFEAFRIHELDVVCRDDHFCWGK